MKSIRKIIFTDIFLLAKIIKTSGVRNDIAALVQEYTAAGTANVEKLGIESIGVILESMPALQNDICEMLGGFAGISADEIASAEIAEIAELIRDICQQNDISNFFGRAAKLAAQKQ